MPPGIRRAVCLLLVATVLAPTAGFAQSQASATRPAPQVQILADPSISRIAAGPDYRLGPGDTLEIVLAGRIESARHVTIVSADGNITIPPLGAVPVGGLTVLEAQRRVAKLAEPLFRFLDLTVTLISTRSFEVTVSGEVERPATLLLAATQRVHQAIAQAGGATARGSLRNVILMKNGREERRLDLLRFLLGGDLDQNPYMTEGISIAVPPKGPAVTLAGSVVRPGEYEIGPPKSLRALLELTGGLATESAAAEARLTRIGLDGKKTTVPLDLTTALTSPADVPLQAGDTIYVPPLMVVQDIVEVRGAFNGTAESAKTVTAGRPAIVQRLELAGGDRVRDIVVRAGGAAPFADLRQAYVERAGTRGPRQTIPVDLHRLMVEKDETQNIVMQNGDVLALPQIEDKVYVVGEVRSPGPYDFRSTLSVREYIALAGGPLARAKTKATTVTLSNGRTYPATDAPPLEPGAVLTVPEVGVKWWQDYAQIASTIASLVTAYTGLFILFGGAREIESLNE
jgi:protein involved in polysaccharide export with SLBB domain